jgi:hypothetical protein
MAYAQWVIILLKNRSQKSIKIKNVKIDWGKFHKDGKHFLSTAKLRIYQFAMRLTGDKDSEISSGTIEGKTIDPGKSYQINSCGRSDAASGTEGSFNLVDDSGHVIRNLYWDCPWGSKTNYWKITGTQCVTLIL